MPENLLDVIAQTLTEYRIPKSDKLVEELVKPTGEVVIRHNAIGTILSMLGLDNQLQHMSHEEAILRAAERSRIPVIQVALIDVIDEQRTGFDKDTRSLSDAIVDPGKLLGEWYKQVMLFSKTIDDFSPADWHLLALEVNHGGFITGSAERFDQKFGQIDANFPQWMRNGREAAQLAARANLFRLRDSLTQYIPTDRLAELTGAAVNEIQVQRHLGDRPHLYHVSLFSDARAR